MRLENISLLRVSAMLMVVYYHCISPFAFSDMEGWNFGILYISGYNHLARMLNCIDMPMFVFLSGYLYAYLKKEHGKYNDSEKFVLGKTKRLLLPYVVWFFIILLLMPERGDISKFFYTIDHLWFLPMLFECFVAITLTQKFWANKTFGINLLCCLLFSGIYFVLPVKPSIFCLDSFLIYFPIFFLGVLFSQHNIPTKILEKSNAKLLLLPLGLTGIGCLLFTDDQFMLHSDTLARVSGLLFSIVLFLLLYNQTEFSDNVCNNIWRSLDRNCMGIYLIHQVFIFLVLRTGFITNSMNNHWIVFPALFFISTLLFSWSVSYLCQKTKLKFILGQ